MHLSAVEVDGASQPHKVWVCGSINQQVPTDAQVEDDWVHGTQLWAQMEPEPGQLHIVGHCGWW